MKNLFLRVSVLLLGLLFLNESSGQFSNEHYLPVSVINEFWGADIPTYRLTSLSITPVTVTVENAFTGAVLTTLTIPVGDFAEWESPYQVAQRRLTPEQLGIRMTANEPFSVTGYGDLLYRTMGFSWTSKGEYGRGREFRLYAPSNPFRPDQVNVENYGNYYSIIAAEDATVTVSGLPEGNGTYNLLRGQTIVIDGGTSENESQYIGQLIQSTGDIVILNQTVQFLNGGINGLLSNTGRSDDGADILVPITSLGNRYFVSIGSSQNVQQEYVTIVAAYDNTEVTVNGTVIATLNAGEYRELSNNFWANNESMLIETSQKVYVWHKVQSGTAPQDGYYLAPPASVANLQTAAVIPPGNYSNFDIAITTQQGAILTVNGAVQTPSSTIFDTDIYRLTGLDGTQAYQVISTSPITIAVQSYISAASTAGSYGGWNNAQILFTEVGEPTNNNDFDTNNDGLSDACFLYVEPNAFPGYQWIESGIDISGETDYYTRIEEEGNYSVRITGLSGATGECEANLQLNDINCLVTIPRDTVIRKLEIGDTAQVCVDVDAIITDPGALLYCQPPLGLVNGNITNTCVDITALDRGTDEICVFLCDTVLTNRCDTTIILLSIIDPGLNNVICDDNNTPSRPEDDFVSFSLDPFLNANSTSYQVSVNNGATINPTTASYGSPTSFALQNGSANGTNYQITITDSQDPNCFLTISTGVINSCSSVTCEITCPADVIIDCAEDNSPSHTGEARPVDDPDNDISNIWHQDFYTAGTCEDRILRRWYGQGICEAIDSCDQIIVIRDMVAPTFLTNSSTFFSACNYQVPPYELTDNCGIMEIDTQITRISQSCPHTFTDQITYIATDSCQLSDTLVFTFQVADNEPPTITSENWNITITDNNTCTVAPYTNVQQINNLTPRSLTDNCGEITVEHREELLPEDDCAPRVVRRYYRFTDECNNTSEEAIQDITYAVECTPLDSYGNISINGDTKFYIRPDCAVAPITVDEQAQGICGYVEYMWMMSTEERLPEVPYIPTESNIGNIWHIIPNANEVTYTPARITQNTYYVRCVRNFTCCGFQESNIVGYIVDNEGTCPQISNADCTEDIRLLRPMSIDSDTSTYRTDKTIESNLGIINQQVLKLHAQEGTILREGFEVQSSAQLEITTHGCSE